MFEAAANNKMILTSDTQTTQEYFDECQRMGKDVRQWREAIRYYLAHEEKRNERAMAFQTFLKEESHEAKFAETVKKLCDLSCVPAVLSSLRWKAAKPSAFIRKASTLTPTSRIVNEL